MSKLYIVVRADLPAGAQLAQSNHVAIHAALCWPDAMREWSFESGNLVIVAVPDVAALNALADRLAENGARFVRFVEPDFAYAATAIALHPSVDARRMLSSLPLALRPRAAA